MQDRQLLNIWDSDLRVFCHGHYDVATHLDRRNYQLGIPVVVLSAIVGTSVFASVSLDPSLYAKIGVGLISILVAVLGSLQTFLRLAERAEKHREAGARFGALLKEIEQHQAVQIPDDELTGWCTDFRVRWDRLSAESPTIPRRIYKKHHAKQKNATNSKVDYCDPAEGGPVNA